MNNKVFVGVMIFFCVLTIFACWGSQQIIIDNTPENLAKLENREDWRLSRSSSISLVVFDDTTLKEGLTKSVLVVLFFIGLTYYAIREDTKNEILNNTN